MIFTCHLVNDIFHIIHNSKETHYNPLSKMRIWDISVNKIKIYHMYTKV